MKENENKKIEIILWMNGKIKEYSFKYKIENNKNKITLSLLKKEIIKYIINKKKLLLLINKTIQDLQLSPFFGPKKWLDYNFIDIFKFIIYIIYIIIKKSN